MVVVRSALFRLVWATLLALLSIGATASCKKKVTNKEILDKYRGDLEKRQKELEKIRKNVPDAFDEKVTAKLDPKLKYSKAFSNAILVPIEAIDDMTQAPETKPYLGFDYQHIGAIRDLDLPPSQVASPSLDDQMRYAAVAKDYVIVYRVAAYEPVVATDDTSFEGGELTVEAYVLDWKKAKVRAAVRVQGEPDMSGSFKYKEGEDKQKALESVVETSLHRNTMEKLARELSSATGGKVVFDELYGAPKEPNDDDGDGKKKKSDDDDDED